jgi:hypothetical protein
MARPAAPQGEAICNRVLREFYVQWNFKQIAAQKASVGFLFGIGIRHSLVDRQNARLAVVSEANFAPRRAAEPRKCFGTHGICYGAVSFCACCNPIGK